MKIEDNTVVTIDYELTDQDGTVLDSSEGGNFAYLHGANNIIPGLENALTGKSSGDQLSVAVPPEEGYGARDESRMQAVPRDMFPSDTNVEVGMQFHAEGPDGQVLVVSVASVDGDQVTVDGNHPLAGVNLNFEVNVLEVRGATDEEIDHGHVHGPGDAHHH